jgi:c-di-GMP-related signal transduction protein
LTESLVRASASAGEHLLPLQRFSALQHLCDLEFTEHALLRLLTESPDLHAHFLVFARDICQLPPNMALERAAESVGARNLRVFALARALDGIPETSWQREVCFIAVQRGRFLELTATALDIPVEQQRSLFFAGLLATLPAICEASLYDVFHHLHVGAPVSQLLHEPDETASMLFSLLLAIEVRDFDRVAELLAPTPITGEQAALLYGKAAIWSRRVLGSAGAWSVLSREKGNVL